MLLVASRMAATYELLDRIGCGGMATIHRARQTSIGGFERVVAIKQILPERARDPSFVARFIREAKIASALNHPNVVQIHDFGRSDGGYFIAMEYLEGRALSDIGEAVVRAGLAFPFEVVLAILRQLCDALDHVHNRTDGDGSPLEIVHRDVSPANVIVTMSGHIKLIDFGIARSRDASADPRGLVGKLAYMAPERIRGNRLDSRVDLFAAGVIAWQLITGRRLFFGADDAATIQKVLFTAVPPPSMLRPHCPAVLDDIVLAALAKDPDLRPPTAACMRDLVDHAIRASGRDATPASIARWLAMIQQPLPGEVPELPTGETRARTAIAVTAPARSEPVAARPSPGSSRRRRNVIAGAVAATTALALGGWSGIVNGSTEAPAEPVAIRAPDEAPAARIVATAPELEPAILPAGTREPRSASRSSRRSRRAAREERVEAPALAPIEWPERLAEAPAAAPPQQAVRVVEPDRGPRLVSPDLVRKLSGEIRTFNRDRLEQNELAGRRLSTVLCIDQRGRVTGVRFVSRVPGWVQRALADDLRRFEFSPYRAGGAAAPACFTRQLEVSVR